MTRGSPPRLKIGFFWCRSSNYKRSFRAGRVVGSPRTPEGYKQAYESVRSRGTVSLAGKKILITRPIDQADTLTRLLRERDADVIGFPVLRIGPPPSWDECDEAIDNYRTYDALIFTSVNAVKFFFNRVVERGIQPGLQSRYKVFVVGPKTAEAAASFGVLAARVPGVTTVRMLTEALCAMPVLKKRFLFPKGNLAGSDISLSLRARGATVDEVIVYETLPAVSGGDTVSMDVDGLSALLGSGSIDAITFYSPSSVENFFSIIPQNVIGPAALAVIGPTTAEALHSLSLTEQIIPEHPTTEELVSALERYFSN